MTDLHTVLKNKTIHSFRKYGYTVNYNQKINGQKIDVVLVENGKITGCVMCVATKSLSYVARRLRDIPYDKFIVRYRKKRTPCSIKLLKQMKRRGITILEFPPPSKGVNNI